MNPSKTANPTTGVVEAGPYSCLTRKTKHFWHHKLVQTNTLLDSQTTNTHPSPQPKKEPCSLGASVSMYTFRLATRRAGGCLLYIVASIRATRSSSSFHPDRSRSERPSPFLAARQPGQQYTPRHPCAKRAGSQARRPRGPGSDTGFGLPRRGSPPCLQATGSTSSGESLRTLPTALPTLCRVTLAGST